MNCKNLIIVIVSLFIFGLMTMSGCKQSKEVTENIPTEETVESVEPKMPYIIGCNVSDKILNNNESTDIVIEINNPDQLTTYLKAQTSLGTIDKDQQEIIGNTAVIRYTANEMFFKEPGEYTNTIGLKLEVEGNVVDTATAVLYVINEDTKSTRIRSIKLIRGQ